MSKKILIDTFFNQFTDFLKQLENMYPDDTDFPVFITTLNLLKSTNPILVVKFVKENIVDINIPILVKNIFSAPTSGL